MFAVPVQLKNDYTRLLTQRDVLSHSHNYYLKWLRFYLDFSSKYHHNPDDFRSSLPLFIGKLHEKNQTSRLPELLGEPDEDSFGAPDVAEPILVFVLGDFADEFRAAFAGPGKRIVDVLHGEHDT